MNNLFFRCASTQRQIGTNHCGLFALAFAYALANGKQPGEFTFNHSSMRGHLIHCLEVGEILAFASRQRRNKAKFFKDYNLGIYCSCRMPNHTPTSSMIKCSGCGEWYHLNICVTVNGEMLKKGVKWLCYKC